MKVFAEVSLYPLKTQSLSKPIGDFCGTLEKHGLEVMVGPMSTRVSGDADAVFRALKDAFVQSAERGGVVMVLKVSNTCPEGYGG